jgi:hypothetical protein
MKDHDELNLIDENRLTKRRILDSFKLQDCSFDDLEPESGADYVAFGVHSPTPNILLAFAIAHRVSGVGARTAIDLVGTAISRRDADTIAKRFGTHVSFGDKDEASLLAAMGATSLVLEQSHIRAIN